MILRDYQRESVSKVMDQFQKVRSTLMVYATGLGKTIVFAYVAGLFRPKRTLVVCERKELVDQACHKIQAVTGMRCQREMADFWSGETLLDKAPVVVATIQTLNARWGEARRMHRFVPKDIGLVICDESHHSAADQYQRFFQHILQNPDVKILGVTATPNRHDGKPIVGSTYETIADTRGIKFGIDNGWLVDISQERIVVNGLDYSHVHVRGGDFVAGELDRILEQERIVQAMIHPSLELIFGVKPRMALGELPQAQWTDFLREQTRQNPLVPRRTILFTASVAQAEMACSIFNRAYPGLAGFVHAKTKDDERNAILSRFRSGETPVICNQGILLEGFDEPAVEIILMGRPTLSTGLYTQMLGRSTRPLPGVIDGIELASSRISAIKSSNKPVCRCADYVGNSGRHKLVDSFIIKSDGYTPEEIELARLNATNAKRPKMVSVLLSEARIELEKQRREAERKKKEAEEERRRSFIARVTYAARVTNPMGDPNQRESSAFIRRFGRVPSSPSQIKKLAEFGIDASRFPKDFSRVAIGKIAANGWRLPDELKRLRRK